MKKLIGIGIIIITIVCTQINICIVPRYNNISRKNIEALASGEIPGGDNNKRQAYPAICGAAIPGTKKTCQATIITCQGTGTGCSPRNCPTHMQ